MSCTVSLESLSVLWIILRYKYIRNYKDGGWELPRRQRYYSCWDCFEKRRHVLKLMMREGDDYQGPQGWQCAVRCFLIHPLWSYHRYLAKCLTWVTAVTLTADITIAVASAHLNRTKWHDLLLYNIRKVHLVTFIVGRTIPQWVKWSVLNRGDIIFLNGDLGHSLFLSSWVVLVLPYHINFIWVLDDQGVHDVSSGLDLWRQLFLVSLMAKLILICSTWIERIMVLIWWCKPILVITRIWRWPR